SDVSPSVTALPPPPPPPPRPANSFDFGRPFAFVFEDPEWVQKILLGGVFVLASVVIVGIFFVYGYVARLVRNVIDGVQYPLPAWDDHGEQPKSLDEILAEVVPSRQRVLHTVEGLRLFAVAVVYVIPIIVLT